MAPLESYVGGAMVFAQESLKRFFDDHGEATLAEGAPKKGTLIFTGTLVRTTRPRAFDAIVGRRRSRFANVGVSGRASM
jgi:hypothetical protein